jgi:DNA primase
MFNLNSVDSVELLENLGISYEDEGKNIGTEWVGVNCPFCDDDSNHCGVHINAPVFSCFRCGEKGNLIKLVAQITGNKRKAIEIIKGNIPRELRKRHEFERNFAERTSLPSSASKMMSKSHYKYLEQQRRFNARYLHEKYDLHFVHNDDDWWNRIIVPVYMRGELITFTSISIDKEARMRYKHQKDEESIAPIKQILYGSEWCGRSCITVEGIFDFWRIGDGAVMTGGTKITSEQKKLLSKYDKVILLFDGDFAGRIAAQKLGDDLSAHTEVKIIDLPDNVDPDGLTDEEIKYIRSLL